MTLREYLKQSGATQREFSKETGIDTARLSRIVSGDVWPTLEQAFEIERATNRMVKAETFAKKAATR